MGKEEAPPKGLGLGTGEVLSYRLVPQGVDLLGPHAEQGREPPGFLDLFRVSSVPIRRHAKVRSEATAYDPAYDDYFRQGREKQRRMRARARAQARKQP